MAHQRTNKHVTSGFLERSHCALALEEACPPNGACGGNKGEGGCMGGE